MINFNFGLSNPFSSRWDNVYSRSVAFDRLHKAVEFEVYRDTTIICLMFRLTARQDHGGVMLDIGLLGYSVSLHYYDTRHWNEDEGRYYNYDNAGKAS